MLSNVVNSLLFVKYFNTILPYSLSSPIILQHSTTFHIILQHSSLFHIIRQHFPSFIIFRQHLTTSPIILQHLTTFDNISYISTTLSLFRQIDNIFLQYFSTTFFFDIIRQHSTKSFFDKNFLSFAVK